MDMSNSPVKSNKGQCGFNQAREDLDVHSLPLDVKVEALNVQIERLTELRDSLIREAA